MKENLQALSWPPPAVSAVFLLGLWIQRVALLLHWGLNPIVKGSGPAGSASPCSFYSGWDHFFTWHGQEGWCDVPVCTPGYFKPSTSCKVVLCICSGREDLSGRVMSIQTAELMARWTGGERVVPWSHVWNKRVQAPNLEGRKEALWNQG